MVNEHSDGEHRKPHKLVLSSGPHTPPPSSSPDQQADWVVSSPQQEDLTVPISSSSRHLSLHNSLGISAKMAAMRSPVSPASGPPPNAWTPSGEVSPDPGARNTRNLRPEDLIRRTTTPQSIVRPPRESLHNFVYLVKTERAYQVLLGALALVVVASLILVIFLNIFLFSSPSTQKNPNQVNQTVPGGNTDTVATSVSLTPTYTYVTPTITPTMTVTPTSTTVPPGGLVTISGPPADVTNGMTLYIYVSSNIANAQVQVLLSSGGTNSTIGTGHTDAVGKAQITWHASTKKTVNVIIQARILQDGDWIVSNQLNVRIRTR